RSKCGIDLRCAAVWCCTAPTCTSTTASATAAPTSAAESLRREDDRIETRAEVAGLEISRRDERVFVSVRVEQPLGPTFVHVAGRGFVYRYSRRNTRRGHG